MVMEGNKERIARFFRLMKMKMSAARINSRTNVSRSSIMTSNVARPTLDDLSSAMVRLVVQKRVAEKWWA